MTDGGYEAQVGFTRPPEAVFDALTTVRGFAGWWSPAAGGGTVAGDVLRLDHNGKGTLVLEVDAAERPRFVAWCVRAYTLNEEWAGTRITFRIQPGATAVRRSRSPRRPRTGVGVLRALQPWLGELPTEPPRLRRNRHRPAPRLIQPAAAYGAGGVRGDPRTE